MARQVARASTHVEPSGAVQTARHYIRELIYGANDGLITTFAVVAGVSGGGLPQHVVLIVGAANLFADGLSMAVGNYLAMATFLAFVTAGTVPLFPYMIGGDPAVRFHLSTAFTLAALFLIGASRSLIGRVTWWLGGVEMLALGAVVAAVAFASGSIVAAIADAVATP